MNENLTHIPGYEIREQVFASRRSLVYRALRIEDQKPVILKLLSEASLSSGETTRYLHEYQLLKKCQSPLVIDCFGLERYQGTPYLVLEDIGGSSLRQLRPFTKMSLMTKLKIASKIAGALGAIHRVGVIHKDINPSNIIYNPESDELRVIDFGIASLSEKTTIEPIAISLIEGSIPYLSPEQTGRMNRSCDYRSDLYSLGVTLYELFTSKLPFDFKDDLKTIHYHIAKKPTPCTKLNADICPTLGALIMKLLEKQAEDRYQSAWGLRSDVAAMIELLTTTGAIKPFQIAASDIPDRFIFPERLYGRHKEVSELLRSFDRVCDGQSEVMLIGGSVGVGKTSLIKEIYLPVSARRGYFVSGKCQELGQNTPFAPLFDALDDLIRQLLTEPEDRIISWRHQILEALGPNAELMTQVLPDLETIIGVQAKASPLTSPQAQKNRFYLVFKNFMQIFCRSEHPLVLFLDDIQWMDQSSLELIQLILRDHHSKYLLLIGSFRQNLLEASHPLRYLIQSHQALGREIQLMPLGLEDVAQVLKDCLHAPLDQLQELSGVVLQKTNGNPFFMEQFLRGLIADGMIWFDSKRSYFAWNLEQIKNCQITSDVVDLLVKKLTKMPANLQHILQAAACIGHKFHSGLVHKIIESTPEQLDSGLNDAIDHGFIHPVVGETSVYSFSHSRFHQAAYELVPKSDKPFLHYRIGKLLMADKKSIDFNKNIFPIVSHFNAAKPLIKESEDRIELAKLNLQAGRKSMKSSGYANGYHFFCSGLELLPADAWRSQYQLCLGLCSEAAGAAFLSSKFDHMNELVGQVIEHGQELLDKMPAYEISVHAAIAQNNLREAATTGRNILKQLGKNLPEKPHLLHIGFAFLRSSWHLWRLAPSEILALPKMTDAKASARINFEFALAQCIYFSEPKLIPLLICDAIDLSLKFGNAQVSSYIYSCYGMLLSGVLNQYPKAVAYAKLGQTLYRKFGGTHFEAPLLVSYNVFIRFWIEPLSSTLKPLSRAHNAGLEVGDQEFATHAAIAYCYHAYYAGKPLQLLAQDMVVYIERIEEMKQNGGLYILKLYQQVVHNLRESSTPWDFNGPYYQKEVMNQRHLDQRDDAGLFATALMQLQIYYLFGRENEALIELNRAKPFKQCVIGTIHEAIYTFYSTLVLTRWYPRAAGYQRYWLWRQIKSGRKKLARWAQSNKTDFKPRLLFVEGEIARIKGDTVRAQRFYDHGIILAKRNSLICEAAMIHEASGLLQKQALSLIASAAYMKKARQYYDRWGALAKVKHLEASYPELLISNPMHLSSSTSTASSTATSTIDIATLKSALLAIAEEKVHSLMIEKIIMTALQFAGASRGVLLLKKDEETFYVEADGTVDQESPRILQGLPLENAKDLPHPIINYIINTKKPLVIDNASVPFEKIPGLSRNDYIVSAGVKSVLCMPIKVGLGDQAKSVGILYLENRVTAKCFTSQRTEILEIICLAAAGRLELSLKAATDGLTGLFNHEYFQNMLVREFLQSRRNLRDLSVIMVDLDHFKQVNDTWGHQVGDLILKRTSLAIQNVCRRSDVIARYGGEEIGIILPETDPLQALLVSERILFAIANMNILVQGQKIQVTASLGVASLSERIADVTSLVKEADQALYQSKHNGRNQVTQAEAVTGASGLPQAN